MVMAHLSVVEEAGADERTSGRADEQQMSQEGLERKCDNSNNKENGKERVHHGSRNTKASTERRALREGGRKKAS